MTVIFEAAAAQFRVRSITARQLAPPLKALLKLIMGMSDCFDNFYPA